MSQSVMHGGNGQPKSQILNFKKPKLSQKQIKEMMNQGYGLKKSNAVSRSSTPMQA